MNTLTPLVLKCIQNGADNEPGSTDAEDEVTIVIDGKGEHLGKMSAGNSKLLVGIVAPYTTNKDAILIELFDEDVIGDRDSLGSAFLSFHHSKVDREYVLKLEGSGSVYELTCFVDI